MTDKYTEAAAQSSRQDPPLTYPPQWRGASVELAQAFSAGKDLIPPWESSLHSRQCFPTQPGSLTHTHTSSGWKITAQSLNLGFGERGFQAASDALWTWQVHAGAGVTVRRADDPSVAALGWITDLDVALKIGPIRSSCRIVHAQRQQPVAGATGALQTCVAYGTLPGHVERGEECFLIKNLPQQANVQGEPLVRGICVAFSQPAWRLARWARPLSSWGQDQMTRRYLREMARAAQRC